MADNNQINGNDVDIPNSLNNSQSITSAFNEAIQQARVSKKGGLDKIDDEGLNELKRQADELIKGGSLPTDKIKEINDAIKEAITKNTALKKSDLGSGGAKKSGSGDQEASADTEPEEEGGEEPAEGDEEPSEAKAPEKPAEGGEPAPEQKPADETAPEEAGQEEGEDQEEPANEETPEAETPEKPAEGGEPAPEQKPADETPKTETPPTEGSNAPEGESPAQAGNKPQQPTEDEAGKIPKGEKPKGGWGAKSDDGKNDMAGKENWANELEKAKRTKQKIVEAKQKIQAAKAKIDEARKLLKTVKTVKSFYNIYNVVCVAAAETFVPIITLWLSLNSQLFMSGFEFVPGKLFFKGFGPKALKTFLPPLSFGWGFLLIFVDILILLGILVVVSVILYQLGFFGWVAITLIKGLDKTGTAIQNVGATVKTIAN